MRFAPFILLTAILLGCGSSSDVPDGPTPPPIPPVIGTFWLVSRDGVPMRIVVETGPGYTKSIAASRLSLIGDHAGSPLQSDVYTLYVTVREGQSQTTSSTSDGVVQTMIDSTTFRLGGLTYLAGIAAMQGDSILLVRSDTTGGRRPHEWRYCRQPCSTAR